MPRVEDQKVKRIDSNGEKKGVDCQIASLEPSTEPKKLNLSLSSVSLNLRGSLPP